MRIEHFVEFHQFKNPRIQNLNFSPYSVRYSATDNLTTIFHTVLRLRKNFETSKEDRERVKRTSPRRSRRRGFFWHGREGRCRTIVMTDPCVPPWKPSSLAKDLQTLFGGFPPKSIEKETGPDVACMEEIEAARVRVYPRISDFQSIE